MIKDYCTQNNGDCSTCGLVNYGRDCQNIPIGRGGKREGSGRKPLPEGLKRKMVSFRLNPQEAEKVREYLKKLRAE
jgi:hypothetical protein